MRVHSSTLLGELNIIALGTQTFTYNSYRTLRAIKTRLMDSQADTRVSGTSNDGAVRVDESGGAAAQSKCCA